MLFASRLHCVLQVDLAGSERLARTDGKAGHAETGAINKSLSALADVMTAIGSSDSHVRLRRV
jgi:hypothetical protein